jgi:Ca2+-binding EF-hand superfamily protein
MRSIATTHDKPGQRWPGFCLLACLSCCVQAQVRDSGDYLARMDADHDGRISLPEYQQWLGYAFNAMDRDHDGTLSAAEQPGGRGAPLTRETHRARLAARFARQDHDHDGFLNAQELVAPP